MITNTAGRQIIMDAEGLRLEAYKCPGGMITIGYGHTGDVRLGDRITRHQAESILEVDLDRFERGVGALVPRANQNQFSAYVALAFNIGLRAFENSTTYAKFSRGDIPGAAAAFMMWRQADGVVQPGLVRRRAAERNLFLSVPS